MKNKIVLLFPVVTLLLAPNSYADETLKLQEIVVVDNSNKIDGETSNKQVINLDDKKGSTLADALKKSNSSVVVLQHGTPGSLVTLKTPGTHSNQTLVLIDDIPLSSGRGIQFDISHLPKNWFKSAEILQGPQGHIYGGYAVGGAVNLQSKEVSEERKLVAFTGGSTLLSANEGASFEGKINNIGTQLSAELSQAASGAIDNSAFNGIYEYGGLKFENNNFQTSFKQFFLRSDKDLPATPSFNFIGNQKTTQHLSIAKISYNDFHTSIAHQFSNIDYTSTNQNTNTVNNSLFFASKKSIPLTSWTKFNARLDANSNWSNGSTPTSIFEYSTGVSASEDFSLFKDSLVLSAGGRLDWFNRLGFEKNYGLGFNYNISEHYTLFGNYATGFTPPNYAELFGFPGFNVANPDLKSSHSRGTDVGLKTKYNKVSATMRLFSLWHKQLIVPSFTPQGLQYQNISNSFAYGMTRALNWEIFPWLEAMWEFSSVFHKDNKKEEIPLTPKYQSAFSFRFPSEKWALTTSYLYRGRMDDISKAPIRSNHDIGLSLLVSLTKNFEVELNASNLLNLHREDMKDYPLPGRAVGALVRITL